MVTTCFGERRMKKWPFTSVFSVSLGAVLALSNPCIAQTANSSPATQDNSGSSRLQENIVTAEKRAQSIQKIPASRASHHFLWGADRKNTPLKSSHPIISYALFFL